MKSSDHPLLSKVASEVQANVSDHLHPQVASLVQAFIKYLKEPRYQAPLSLSELSHLFHVFYQDLNSLVINIYSQSNSNKRQLLASSTYFKNNPKQFDYLLAIANYSSSSIKLLKRSDPAANLQLRVFNYYKFVTIIESIERAQLDLFSSSNNINTNSFIDSFSKHPASNEVILYDKIFKFDQRDILIQQKLDQKLKILCKLNLPFSCFSENAAGPDDSAQGDDRISQFFATLSATSNPLLARIQKKFVQLDQNITPSAKLKCIAKIQKYLILLLSEVYDGNLSKVNNDVLLPSLIYLIVYHLPSSQPDVPSTENDSTSNDDTSPHSSLNLYLNFTFVQNFSNTLEPYKVDASLLTSSSSVSSYKPNNNRKRQLASSSLSHSSPHSTLTTPTSTTFPTGSSTTGTNPASTNTKKQPLSNNLFELLNLDEASSFNEEEENADIDFFNNDKDLISYVQNTYLNNGELFYYLTNFEAILFFLSNVTIDELSQNQQQQNHEQSNDTSETDITNDPLLRQPLHKLVDAELTKQFEDEHQPKSTNDNTKSSLNNNATASAVRSIKSSDDLKAQEKVLREELDENRSRSSSLFNTISSKLNDATSFTANRSRSNSSSIFKHTRSSSNLNLNNSSKEAFPTSNDGADFESSLMTPPLHAGSSNTTNDGHHDADNSSLSVMKSILNRFSSVSVSQFRPSIEETLTEPVLGVTVDVHNSSAGNSNSNGTGGLHSRSSSLMNRLSPNHSRTRSSSLEQMFANGAAFPGTLFGSVNNDATNHSDGSGRNNSTSSSNSEKRNSLTSKFTSGVSEFMTKLNGPTGITSASNNNVTTPTSNDITPSSNSKFRASASSLQSLTEGNSDNHNNASDDHSIGSSTILQKRPEYSNRSRTTSLQIMDKWFNNLSANVSGSQQQSQQHKQKVQNQQQNSDQATIRGSSGIVSSARDVSSHDVSSVDSPSDVISSDVPEVATSDDKSGANTDVISHPITMIDSESNVPSLFSDSYRELTKFQNVDFDLLTISDLRNLKCYYDQLCSDLVGDKTESKTSYEDHAERLADSGVTIVKGLGDGSPSADEEHKDQASI